MDTKKIAFHFLPFWIFLTLFKFAGGLHYSLISPFGEKLMPLWVVGLLMGGTSLIQLLLDVPAGHILDRFGYRKFLTITTTIFLLAALCFFFNFTTITFLFSIILATFGWLFFGPGVNAYILSQAPKENSGKFISFRDTFGSLGIVAASITLTYALGFNIKSVGALLSFAFIFALAAIVLSPKDLKKVSDIEKIPGHDHYIKRHFITDTWKTIKKLNPASGVLLLLYFSASTFYGTIWFVVPLIIVHNINSGLLSIGLGVFDFAIVLLGYFLGDLADKADKRTLVFFGLLIFSIAGILLGFNFSWLFLIFGFLATAGDEMASISLWSWLHSLDREHAQDGAVAGIINLFDDLGWTVGPIFAGIFYGIIGPAWTIAVSAIFIIITWLTYQSLAHHHIRVPHLPSLDFVPAKPHRTRHKR